MEVTFDCHEMSTTREMEVPPREGEIVFLDDELFYVVSVMWGDPEKSADQDVTVELSETEP